MLVTGATSGFGLALAAELVERGAHVAICGRDAGRLAIALKHLKTRLPTHELENSAALWGAQTDVLQPDSLQQLFHEIETRWGGLDSLMHMVGRSSRGRALETTLDQFRASFELNFISAAACVQQAMPMLNRGMDANIVLMGSLASKAAGKFMGPYSAGKFPLAAFAQQLRRETNQGGPHVLLVCPGPIADAPGEAVQHCEEKAGNITRTGLPASAMAPGAGVRVKAIDPQWLARRILLAVERREKELVVPQKARILFALQQISARWGDWLLGKFER